MCTSAAGLTLRPAVLLHLEKNRNDQIAARELSRVAREAGKQEVLLLATVPLTEEDWRPLPPGGLHIYANGQEIPQPGQRKQMG